MGMNMRFRLLAVVLSFAVVSAASIIPAYCAPRLLFSIPPFKFLICEDVNGDGRVTVDDLGVLREVFGNTVESANWNPRADLNGNGIVDIFDAVRVATVLASPA
jgi:hypothetical protein